MTTDIQEKESHHKIPRNVLRYSAAILGTNVSVHFYTVSYRWHDGQILRKNKVPVLLELSARRNGRFERMRTGMIFNDRFHGLSLLRGSALVTVQKELEQIKEARLRGRFDQTRLADSG